MKQKIIMSLRFKGGNILQKGRGIGGLLRAASSLFKPLFRSVGSTALKVARSDVGKAIGKTVKKQAITSAKNIALDTVRGGNIRDSVRNEVTNVRKRVADEFENVVNEPKKRKVVPKSRKKKKKITYANRYSDVKSSDWLSK
jgi:hypothetical protein